MGDLLTDSRLEPSGRSIGLRPRRLHHAARRRLRHSVGGRPCAGPSGNTPLTAWTPLEQAGVRPAIPQHRDTVEKESSLVAGDHYCVRIRAVGETSSDGQPVYGDYTYLPAPGTPPGPGAFTYEPTTAPGSIALPQASDYLSPIEESSRRRRRSSPGSRSPVRTATGSSSLVTPRSRLSSTTASRRIRRTHRGRRSPTRRRRTTGRSCRRRTPTGADCRSTRTGCPSARSMRTLRTSRSSRLRRP